MIGGEDKPSVTVSVFNTGEPVFLPNVTVSVDSPLALILPNTHSCNFPNADNRTFLACRLRNPIMPDEKVRGRMQQMGNNLVASTSVHRDFFIKMWIVMFNNPFFNGDLFTIVHHFCKINTGFKCMFGTVIYTLKASQCTVSSVHLTRKRFLLDKLQT